MNKHAFSRLFALVAALVMLTLTPALAASCTLCGAETGSDDYLCTDCLLNLLNQKAEAAPLEIASCVQNPDGTVTLTWTDAEGCGPYAVYYELLETAPVAFGWQAAEGLTEPTHTLTRLAPGVSYLLTVEDSQGRCVEYIWYAGKPGDDAEISKDVKIGAKLELLHVLRNGMSTTETSCFSLAEIMGENAAQHGLRLQLRYSMLARSRDFFFQIDVKAPNGLREVIYNGELHLNHGKSTIAPWNFVGVDDFFGLLRDFYGSIPTGAYEVTFSLRGVPVHTTTFTVTE